MEKQKVVLIGAGIILGIVAIFLTKTLIDQQRKEVQEQAKRELSELRKSQTAVLLAKENISRGATITAKMIEPSIVPNKYVKPDALTSADRIVGMVAATPIAKGEQISKNLLVAELETETVASLSAATPIGKRAMTIPVDDITSVGGMVRPGDHVDVIGLLPLAGKDPEGKDVKQVTTVQFFQNVLVLAVGKQIEAEPPRARVRRKEGEEEKSKAPAVNMVTMALAPTESNLLAFALEQQTKIRLVLRAQADSKVEPVQLATWDSIIRLIMPDAATQKPPEAKPPARTIEVYRGLKKEVVQVDGEGAPVAAPGIRAK
jgi:pilus assembly protein CpaB